MSSTDDAASMFATAAWWDPQGRKAIFNRKSVTAGVFVAVADTGQMAFASPTDVVFDVRRGDAECTFLRSSSAIDVREGESTFRIHLTQPVPRVPLLDKDSALAIGLKLTGTATLIEWAARTVDKPVDELTDTELSSFAATILSEVAADVAAVHGRSRYVAFRSAWPQPGT